MQAVLFSAVTSTVAPCLHGAWAVERCSSKADRSHMFERLCKQVGIGLCLSTEWYSICCTGVVWERAVLPRTNDCNNNE
jgi:hypothetical protein